MGTITALKAQQRNRERVNVYIDGQFAFGLALPAAAGLRVGQSLSAAEIAGLQQQDTLEKARQSALNFLSFRPRSEAELRRNLQQKDVDEAVIDQVVNYLEQTDLLNDEAFARYWVEQRETFKPRSRLALRQELAQKGVGRTVIDAVLDDVDDVTAARRAAGKRAYRWADLPEEEFRSKLAGYLQRRGFNYSDVRIVVEQFWQELSDPDHETT